MACCGLPIVQHLWASARFGMRLTPYLMPNVPPDTTILLTERRSHPFAVQNEAFGGSGCGQPRTKARKVRRALGNPHKVTKMHVVAVHRPGLLRTND